MTKTWWKKIGTWTDKRRAKRQARGLRLAGEDRGRARVVKEVYWRVDYLVVER